MSYFVISVYSFACDYPRCPETFECAPDSTLASPLLDEAHRELRAEGWVITGRGSGRRHFCPAHKPGKDAATAAGEGN